MVRIEVFQCNGSCQGETRDLEKDRWITIDGTLVVGNKEIKAVDDNVLHFCSVKCMEDYLKNYLKRRT